MSSDKQSPKSSKKNISIGGDVVDSVVISGDHNVVNKTVNQTIIQKFFNIFKSDSETLEQRNRRILLGHIENAWIKGVLDASLHGAALLDLGIKHDPEAVTKYPWAIKKDSTDETLPVGTSMLEIFDSIGMGRSLLILGAPGSGKTTMLLELARQLIACAREDVTQPIPMVFNLASWTEKLTLADWLAQELNNLYSVPRKTAPDWVKGDKLLLLLDGLDEVRQESRAKCVEAINEFRKQNGLTSLAVCSRSQDYADLNTKLSLEGAIEVQPLTQEQIHKFFNRFGDEMAGIKQVLKKDSALREMAETPLFLSIMILAYRDKRDVEILVSGDERARRKHLFDTYIVRMFERSHSKNTIFKKQNVLRWLSWLARRMVAHNQVPYLLERMQPSWLESVKQERVYRLRVGLSNGLIVGLIAGLFFGLLDVLVDEPLVALRVGLFLGSFFGLLAGLSGGGAMSELSEIKTADRLGWSWERARYGLLSAMLFGLLFWLIGELLAGPMIIWLFAGLTIGQTVWLVVSIDIREIKQTSTGGQRLIFSLRNAILLLLSTGMLYTLSGMLISGLPFGLLLGLMAGLSFWSLYGGLAIIQHYTLRSILVRNNLLPWRLVPFLDHCVDLIFLRRIGGGYIFIHRLLMEHFAEMYAETLTSKGNQK
ncbi:MAG: hypothetical protein CVU44_12930 [Chloroflexi bacterium HGW-Chloroflexi-6]|nr:MAG: hypothetical protein CVU44_12930 [Chloroflexi bacterium HGW-Chloroflexi-6]